MAKGVREKIRLVSSVRHVLAHNRVVLVGFHLVRTNKKPGSGRVFYWSGSAGHHAVAGCSE